MKLIPFMDEFQGSFVRARHCGYLESHKSSPHPHILFVVKPIIISFHQCPSLKSTLISCEIFHQTHCLHPGTTLHFLEASEDKCEKRQTGQPLTWLRFKQTKPVILMYSITPAPIWGHVVIDWCEKSNVLHWGPFSYTKWIINYITQVSPVHNWIFCQSGIEYFMLCLLN